MARRRLRQSTSRHNRQGIASLAQSAPRAVSHYARKTVPRTGRQAPAGYVALLDDIKARIRAAQIKASLTVNRELIELYWSIGRDLVQRQRDDGWGKSTVERLAADLQREFPGIGGFSSGNIWRMRSFYLAWTAEVLAQPARDTQSAILAQPARELGGQHPPQAAAQIPWFHNVWTLAIFAVVVSVISEHFE